VSDIFSKDLIREPRPVSRKGFRICKGCKQEHYSPSGNALCHPCDNVRRQQETK
jgi:hypothetical protein